MIDVKKLYFSYTEKPFVEDVSFHVGRGEIFGFLGPSGAGKSTIQKVLTGLNTKYKGSVKVAGIEIRERTNRFYENIGVDFEFSTCYEKFTARQNLETVLAEKYETIIRRNIGTTRARDYYDLHTLYRSRKDVVQMEVLRAAVIHTAEKRDSVDDIMDWRDILKDIREEPQLYLLWDNYAADNKYIGDLKFNEVLDTVDEIAKILDL